MTTVELSREEEIHLYNLSCIPVTVVSVILAAYFVYLMQNNLLESLWDYLTRVGLLIAIIPTTVLFMTFEILYRRQVKKPLGFHVKRFAGRMAIALTVTLSLFIIFGFFSKVVSLPMSEWNILIFSAVIWFLLWFIAVVKLKETLNKLNKASW